MVEITTWPRTRAEELYDLGSKVFSSNGYFDFLKYCRQTYFGSATYDWSASRVAVEDGRLISHVGIWEYQMRVGRARLRTGGIGLVLTHPEHRKGGLASQVMRAVMASMAQGGYHLSTLFGIRNFYHRFGFAQGWPETRCYIKLEDLPADKLELSPRKVSLEEALCRPGTVMRIFERENAGRTGTAVRPIFTRTCQFWKKLECRTLNSAGKVVGYLVTEKRGDDLWLLEVGGLGKPCGLGQLLAAAGKLARQQDCRRMCAANLAYDHPLMMTLRGLTCSVEMHHTRSGGAMVAVVNLRESLKAMERELSARLASSALSGYTGALHIVGDQGQSATLDIRRGAVRALDGGANSSHKVVAGAAAGRLLIGSDSPAALAIQNGVKFTGQAIELAEVLFSRQWPMLHQIDHF